MLGKHSDIALFSERSEVTVNYKSSSDLEEAIKERVKRLLNADVVDVTPITPEHLDEELGVSGEYADILVSKENISRADEFAASLSGSNT